MTQIAIVYGRFSTSEQSKGLSLERQTKRGTEYALKKKWAVEKVLMDEGRSAFHGANRLEGSALHEFELEAKNGLHRGKTLVVENIDRLSRQGAKAAAQLIWALNEHGVSVATYHGDHVYAAGASSELMDLFRLIILAQTAHEESVNKSDRTRDNWASRFKQMEEGTLTKPIPHVPPWIKKVEGGHVLDEYRTRVLNEIFDLYIGGMGITRIANLLNQRNEPVWSSKSEETKNGWFYGYIWRLLTKRSALGEYVASDGRTIAADFFPQAVTAEKFNQAQATLAMRKSNQKRSRNQNRNLLLQMVFCAQCDGGAHFHHTTDTPQTYTNACGLVRTYRRKTKRHLRCDRSRRKHQCDNSTKLDYDIVEGTILQELLPQLVQRAPRNDDEQALRETVAELTRQQDATKSRLNNLIDVLADGGSKALMERVTQLEAEVEAQDRGIHNARQELLMRQSMPSNVDDVALIKQLKDDLYHADDDVRISARGRVNLSLRRLIKRIEINPDDTFTVRPDDHSWWLFDKEGRLLEGEYAL